MGERGQKKISMFLSIEKASRILRISTSTLRRWDKGKKLLPAFRTIGGHRRYEMRDLLGITNQVPAKKGT